MPRVSLVGNHGGAEDYATIVLWWAAESGIDYGGLPIEAACLGACGSGYTLSGSSVNGAKVYTSGVVYDGTNDSSLATTDRLSLSANIDFDSIKIQSNNAFVAALNIASAANGCQLTKLVVEHSAVAPSGVDAIVVNSTVPLSLLTNSIIIGGVNGIDYGFDAVLNVSNVIQFGAVSGDGFEGIGTNGTITNTFSFNNSVNDYINVTLTTCASEDATGSVGWTGYTSAELVDFASRDFRTKATSDLADNGSGGFIGAFLESGGEPVEENYNFSATINITPELNGLSNKSTNCIAEISQSTTLSAGLKKQLNVSGAINQKQQQQATLTKKVNCIAETSQNPLLNGLLQKQTNINGATNQNYQLQTTLTKNVELTAEIAQNYVMSGYFSTEVIEIHQFSATISVTPTTTANLTKKINHKPEIAQPTALNSQVTKKTELKANNQQKITLLGNINKYCNITGAIEQPIALNAIFYNLTAPVHLYQFRVDGRIVFQRFNGATVSQRFNGVIH